MSTSPCAISIVIPLHNEQDSVRPLQDEVATAMRDIPHEVILVDDGSKDDTLARIQRNEHTRVLSFRENRGQSAAIYHGLTHAQAPIVATLDGDLQNNPHDIPRLMEALVEDVDFICGYRNNRHDSAFKRWQSRLANRIRRTFTNDGVRDTGCSLKVMRRSCLDALVLFDGMHRFMPALVGAANFRVIEIPVDHRARQHGVSKYGFHNRAWRGLIDLLGVCWLLARRRHLVETTSSLQGLPPTAECEKP